MPTLDQIVNKAVQDWFESTDEDCNINTFVKQACIEYAKSIVPEEKELSDTFTPEKHIANKNYNYCRKQMLAEIAKADNQS
jgi:hypothetical protein